MCPPPPYPPRPSRCCTEDVFPPVSLPASASFLPLPPSCLCLRITSLGRGGGGRYGKLSSALQADGALLRDVTDMWMHPQTAGCMILSFLFPNILARPGSVVLVTAGRRGGVFVVHMQRALESLVAPDKRRVWLSNPLARILSLPTVHALYTFLAIPP